MIGALAIGLGSDRRFAIGLFLMAGEMSRSHVFQRVGAAGPNWNLVFDLPLLTALSVNFARTDMATSAGGIKDTDLLSAGEVGASGHRRASANLGPRLSLAASRDSHSASHCAIACDENCGNSGMTPGTIGIT